MKDQQKNATPNIFTIQEIYQQPDVWKKTINIIDSMQNEFNIFKNKLPENTKIIFTGAGSSEFIGNSLALYFKQLGLNAVSYSTTDIVSNPLLYLKPNQKTLLVSFSRSGSSPESIATVELAQKIIKDNLHQVVITCNKNGALATQIKNDSKSFLAVLPEETHDKGFAMTSSFSSMYLACILLFNYKSLNEILKLSDEVQTILDDKSLEKLVEDLAYIDHQRIVYLGSNILKGIAQESSLKCLELSSGKVISTFNSPLGFRHGPKSIINEKSIVFVQVSQNKHTRKYDIDLIRELASDKKTDKLVVIDGQEDDVLADVAHHYISLSNSSQDDIFTGIKYLVISQIYAVFKSLFLNNDPDNPNPDGHVNRVVEGVVIHEF